MTEETAKAYYDGHAEEFTQPEGRLVSHILIRFAKDADEAAKAEARAKAEAVRKALVEGADFEKLAGEASECLSRSRGGALGVVPRGREAKSFEDAVYGQAIGAIGEVVESPVGFHVIKVTGEQEKKLIPFDEVKDRLINMLRAQAQQKVASEYIQGLREKATIKLDGTLAAAAATAEKAAQEKAAAPEAAAGEAAPAAPAPVTAPAQPGRSADAAAGRPDPAGAARGAVCDRADPGWILGRSASIAGRGPGCFRVRRRLGRRAGGGVRV